VAGTGLIRQPDDAQCLGDGALSRCQDGTLTSIRIWFQTGAVNHGRKTDSQNTKIVGTVG
jgi:hypothetical protein